MIYLIMTDALMVERNDGRVEVIGLPDDDLSQREAQYRQSVGGVQKERQWAARSGRSRLSSPGLALCLARK